MRFRDLSHGGSDADARRDGQTLRLALRDEQTIAPGARAGLALDAALDAEPGEVVLIVADPGLGALGLVPEPGILLLPCAGRLTAIMLPVRALAAVGIPAGTVAARAVALRAGDLRLLTEDRSEDRSLFPERYMTIAG